MFLRSLAKHNLMLFQSEILPPNSDEDQKKSLSHILVLSESRISDFLLPSGYYLPENRGGRHILPPSVLDPRGRHPPKIDTYDRKYN